MMYKLPKKRLIIQSSNGVNWTLSVVVRDGSKPSVSYMFATAKRIFISSIVKKL